MKKSEPKIVAVWFGPSHDRRLLEIVETPRMTFISYNPADKGPELLALLRHLDNFDKDDIMSPKPVN